MLGTCRGPGLGARNAPLAGTFELGDAAPTSEGGVGEIVQISERLRGSYVASMARIYLVATKYSHHPTCPPKQPSLEAFLFF